MVEKVLTGTCYAYDAEKIKEFIIKCLDEIDLKISKSRILLKPNLLSAKPPEKAVTTHPVLIKAISEIFLDYSCDVYVGDSPGYQSTEKVMFHTGVMDVVNSHNLKIVSFDKRIKKTTQGISPYKELILGECPDDFDYIINIPKLKTHTMMGLTLGIKNMFGFIPAFEKAKWHLRAGKDRMLFASLLIDIYNAVKPSITIMDGIVGMDGDGPSNGRVRKFGFLAACKNAFSLDYEIEKMVSRDNPTPINALASEYNLIKKYDVKYIYPQYLDYFDFRKVFFDFKLPSTMNTDWNLPKTVKGVLSSLFVKKPRINKNKCKNCNVCLNVCPVTAISKSEITPIINYHGCIRCYCCHEMCPEGAITIS